ncbi:MAG: hypothetical protein JOZ89_00355, partial [Gammaproteobacteria bacterium]|nr:hypothetical protein [Gammaproteobacteria bacterium]
METLLAKTKICYPGTRLQRLARLLGGSMTALLLMLAAAPGRSESNAPGASALEPPRNFDLVIAHGHIIDGTGSPWYSGDIGIRG